MTNDVHGPANARLERSVRFVANGSGGLDSAEIACTVGAATMARIITLRRKQGANPRTVQKQDE